jgi:hypothetical protein
MATPEQISEWKAAGEAVRAARKARDAIGTRTGEDVKRLREAASATAAVCADCFEPLASGQSVTLVERFVEHIPADHERWLAVPICLHCWLLDLALPPWWARNLGGTDRRGRDAKPIDHGHQLRRCRCEGCERPLRSSRPPGGRVAGSVPIGGGFVTGAAANHASARPCSDAPMSAAVCATPSGRAWSAARCSCRRNRRRRPAATAAGRRYSARVTDKKTPGYGTGIAPFADTRIAEAPGFIEE